MRLCVGHDDLWFAESDNKLGFWDIKITDTKKDPSGTEIVGEITLDHLIELSRRLHSMFRNQYKEVKMIAKDKDKPKRDGSGRGTRANKGRGGCDEPRKKGKQPRR